MIYSLNIFFFKLTFLRSRCMIMLTPPAPDRNLSHSGSIITFSDIYVAKIVVLSQRHWEISILLFWT